MLKIASCFVTTHCTASAFLGFPLEWLLVCMLGPLVVACGPADHSKLTPAATPTMTLDRLGEIAFVVSGPRLGSAIYIMRADGKHAYTKRLTDETDSYGSPAWSPDGARIAFLSSRDGASELYVMRSDGTEIRRLTQNVEPQYTPSWSPDGKRIAFTAFAKDNSFDIWVLSLDTLAITNLTNHPAIDIEPAWSPDGTKIAFASNRAGHFQIYLMGTDGSHVTQLTDDPIGCHGSAWSPDGKRIALACNTNRTDIIEVMNPDGSQRTLLMGAEGGPGGSHPSWSPDGLRLAFNSVRTGKDEIYVMNADGSDVVQLTDFGAIEVSPVGPAWRPIRVR